MCGEYFLLKNAIFECRTAKNSSRGSAPHPAGATAPDPVWGSAPDPAGATAPDPKGQDFCSIKENAISQLNPLKMTSKLEPN